MRRVFSQMRLLAMLWTTIYLLAGIANSSPAGSEREKYNFNSGWKVLVGDPTDASEVAFDDSSWKPVTTPYAWNEDDAFRKDIKDLSTGIAWYRKHFTLPENSNERKVFLEFEGIRHGGEFYVNGKLIGRHENGVMAFGFDITDALKPAPQENVLAVRVDNSWDYHEQATGATYQWSDRNFYANYGGINKNVYLHITNRLYQTLPLYSNLGTAGIYVYAQDFNIKGRSAKITAESQVRNEYTRPKTFIYNVIVYDADGKFIKWIKSEWYVIAPGETKLVSTTARIDGLNYWSWGYGYLYKVRTELIDDTGVLDAVETRTGFRKTEFANGVMKLNDRVVQLKGYAQRTTNEWPALGSAVPAWLSDFSNRLMLESNANLVRWMHVTPWKQDIESCDRLGLMQAMPAGDSEKDVDGRRWEQRVELMRDAIIYNRNNPSIVFYESGNKGISEKHMEEMKAIRDRYDPRGDNARLTFDDNETTEWVSDGKLADGWIKYEFARPERISEVTLKLSNWRTRSYPLRILVDDKPVYTGETPRSLGYVTLSFPAVTGSNLKLELTGRPKDVDAFGQIVEVTGQKDAGSADDKGRIGIVEIEIYDASQTNTPKSSINPRLPTIFVVGDSTANNNANAGRGWGDPFIGLFDATKVNVLNRARAGRSSRTFITQGLWDNVLSEMKRGDIVLIQFGHNDAGTINDASRARGSLPGTGEETEEIDNLLTKQHEVVHTFGWYVRKMIADTKAKGATPIVLSLTVRNIWKDGRVERGSGKFGQWSAEVAASQKVLFVDVTKLIADRYEQLGEEKVKELFATDHTHTNPAGAELNASIILTGLRTLRGKPFDRYLSHR